MRAEQVVYTSIERDGMSGYQVAARSPGVTADEVRAVALWAPSHGGLIVDAANRTSVNFHPLPGGRFALARTCEGPPEYSGRGGRQLYTHALILDAEALRRSGFRPLAIYRDALALGHLRHRSDPGPSLEPAELSAYYPPRGPDDRHDPAHAASLPPLEPLVAQVLALKPVRLAFPGDRIALADCLLGLLPEETIPRVSFATSLQPSAVRPYLITLIGA